MQNARSTFCCAWTAVAVVTIEASAIANPVPAHKNEARLHKLIVLSPGIGIGVRNRLEYASGGQVHNMPESSRSPIIDGKYQAQKANSHVRLPEAAVHNNVIKRITRIVIRLIRSAREPTSASMRVDPLAVGEGCDERIDLLLIRTLAPGVDARTCGVADPQHNLVGCGASWISTGSSRRHRDPNLVEGPIDEIHGVPGTTLAWPGMITRRV